MSDYERLMLRHAKAQTCLLSGLLIDRLKAMGGTKDEINKLMVDEMDTLDKDTDELIRGE